MHFFRILYSAVLFFCISAHSLLLIVKENSSGFSFRIQSPLQKSFFPPTDSLRIQLQRVYRAEIGIRENRENRGRRIEEYLRYVGLGAGNPWCAAFVSWAYGQIGIKRIRTGWSPDLFKASDVIYTRTHSSKAPVQLSAGDVFGLWFPEKKRIAHVGFIDQVQGKWLITVEGNTNEAGSREGDGVYRKRRLMRSIYAVSRYL